MVAGIAALTREIEQLIICLNLVAGQSLTIEIGRELRTIEKGAYEFQASQCNPLIRLSG